VFSFSIISVPSLVIYSHCILVCVCFFFLFYNLICIYYFFTVWDGVKMTVRFEERDVGVKWKTTLLTHFSIQSIIRCRKRETHKGQHWTRVGSCVVGSPNLYDPINITLLIIKDYPTKLSTSSISCVNSKNIYILYFS